MKKLILIIIILYPLSANSLEKTKEEKVAKYIIQNIQKDYVTCYSFYKVGAEVFKKIKKDKKMIKSLERSFMYGAQIQRIFTVGKICSKQQQIF